MPSPSDHFQPTSPLQAVIVLQVICACLVFAVVAFGGFTVSQTLGKPPRPPQVAWVGAGSVVVSLMVIGILPWIIDCVLPTPNVDSADADRVFLAWMPRYQTTKILQLATFQVAAFINLVAYFIEHNAWSGFLAGAVAMLMLMGFPTRARAARWVALRVPGMPTMEDHA